MRKIKTFKLFENNSIDYIEGELEDIVVHYCEGTNADFKLDSILCDGGVFIWKVDSGSSMEIRGKENWWNFVKIHNNMASELGYEFYPISDYLLFTKFDNLEGTIIEILDWISNNLEMKVDVTDFNNGYVVGKRLRTSYSYEGKILIGWTKYTNSEGVESLSPMRGSFIRPLKLEPIGAMNKVGVYVDKVIYTISSGIVNVERWIRIIRSWLEERDPLFKEFNISIERNDSLT